jgi:hypothetical protein
VEELSKQVDSLIVVLNDKLLEVYGDDAGFEDCFRSADNVLTSAVGGIAEIINVPGLVNVDFQDVRTAMAEMGRAMMGSAQASGLDRARIAAEQAAVSPLLEGTELSGARCVLINITASRNLKMSEVRDAVKTVQAFAASRKPSSSTALCSTRTWKTASASPWWQPASVPCALPPCRARSKWCVPVPTTSAWKSTMATWTAGSDPPHFPHHRRGHERQRHVHPGYSGLPAQAGGLTAPGRSGGSVRRAAGGRLQPLRVFLCRALPGWMLVAVQQPACVKIQ